MSNLAAAQAYAARLGLAVIPTGPTCKPNGTESLAAQKAPKRGRMPA